MTLEKHSDDSETIFEQDLDTNEGCEPSSTTVPSSLRNEQTVRACSRRFCNRKHSFRFTGALDISERHRTYLSTAEPAARDQRNFGDSTS